MPKELKDITNNVMNQIRQGKTKMKPRVYFIVNAILTFLGLVSSIVISIFLVSLARFSLRTHGPMGQYRFDQIISSFPWWVIIFAFLGIIAGIWLVRRYDFSYKNNFGIIVLVFVLAIMLAGYALDITGLNDTLYRHGPMKGMMQMVHSYSPKNNIMDNVR